MGGFEAAAALLRDLFDGLTGSEGFAVVSWFLAAMFVVGGTTKVRKPHLAALAMVDFGVTRSANRATGAALGWSEMVVATLLGVPATREVGVVAAAALLSAFAVLIARALREGESFPCFCLGDSEAALSKWSLMRTGALAVVAWSEFLTSRAATTSPNAELLSAIAAVSVFGTFMLLGRIPRLVRLNADSPRLGGVGA